MKPDDATPRSICGAKLWLMNASDACRRDDDRVNIVSVGTRVAHATSNRFFRLAESITACGGPADRPLVRSLSGFNTCLMHQRRRRRAAGHGPPSDSRRAAIVQTQPDIAAGTQRTGNYRGITRVFYSCTPDIACEQWKVHERHGLEHIQ